MPRNTVLFGILGNNLALEIMDGIVSEQLDETGDSAIAEYSDCSYDRVSSVAQPVFLVSFVVLRIRCICSLWNRRASRSLTSVRPALLNNIRTLGCLDDSRNANTSCAGVCCVVKYFPKIVSTNILTALHLPILAAASDLIFPYLSSTLKASESNSIISNGAGQVKLVYTTGGGGCSSSAAVTAAAADTYAAVTTAAANTAAASVATSTAVADTTAAEAAVASAE
jgi:hypothetical protein